MTREQAYTRATELVSAAVNRVARDYNQWGSSGHRALPSTEQFLVAVERVAEWLEEEA